MIISTDTLQVIDLSPNLIGFYDGRVADTRIFGEEPNWVDDGGYALGICSYAIHSDNEAIVYDTHLSIAHAERIREVLLARGIARFRVVLSHWHLDHVAGNAAFADCEIIALAETARLLRKHATAIQSGSYDGPPAITPLVMPTSTFSGDCVLHVGRLEVHLRPLDIHSCDGLAIFLPHDGTLLAGDTLEDTVTYVNEPDRLTDHLVDLTRMSTWTVDRIFPNHGALSTLRAGGYDRRLITATQSYVQKLLALSENHRTVGQDLKTFLAAELDSGGIDYFEPYEAIHRLNVARVMATSAKTL